MALRYIDSPNVLWRGEPINDIKHPRNIEEVWSAQELAKVGLEVLPPPPPPTIEQKRERTSASMMATRIVLAKAGLLDRVNTAVQARGDINSTIAWEYAQSIHRESPTLKAIQAVIGLTDEEVDAMFDEAVAITTV